MVDKYIDLLQKQIDKLDSRQLDLKSWKIYTIALLSRIFGEDSRKIKQIEDLKYDFGSWSLRDAAGNKTSLDTVRSMAKEILEAAISELKNFGLPGEENKASDRAEDFSFISEAIGDELKGSQYKALKSIIESGENSEEKKRRIKEIFKEIDHESLLNIMTDIIINPKIADIF